jgi:hypothetical protein
MLTLIAYAFRIFRLLLTSRGLNGQDFHIHFSGLMTMGIKGWVAWLALLHLIGCSLWQHLPQDWLCADRILRDDRLVCAVLKCRFTQKVAFCASPVVNANLVSGILGIRPARGIVHPFC